MGLDAGLMAPCVVKDLPRLTTTKDIVDSRGIYKKGFELCAAKVDAIRAHDAEARKGVTPPESEP